MLIEGSIDKKLDSCKNSFINSVNYITDSAFCNCEIKAMYDWEREINKYYKLILESVRADVKKKFKQDQKSWIDYKNKEFLFLEKSYRDVKLNAVGLYPWYINTKMLLIRKRAIDLNDYYYLLKQ